MFVTFEGLDGSGKSTQAELLGGRLEADGRDVVATREPGGTELGERMRDLVLHGGHVTPWAEALLYAAARAQHVEEVIRPALDRGAAVVCDRYLDSSVAYQGVARGLGLERVLELNLAGGRRPASRSDVPARAGRRGDRAAACGASTTGSSASPTTSTRVRPPGYRELAERFPERIVVLDATRPAERARRGGVWSPSRPFLSSPRRSGSSSAALAEGPAHAFLLHGPAGVGKRARGLRVRGRAPGRRAPGRARARIPTSTCSSRSAR